MLQNKPKASLWWKPSCSVLIVQERGREALRADRVVMKLHVERFVCQVDIAI